MVNSVMCMEKRWWQCVNTKPHNATVSEFSGLATVKKNIFHSLFLIPKINNDLQNLLLVIAAELRTELRKE